MRVFRLSTLLSLVITVLMRSEDKAQKLERLVENGNLGRNVDLKVLRGSNSDLDVLEAQTAKSDVVFSLVGAVSKTTIHDKQPAEQRSTMMLLGGCG